MPREHPFKPFSYLRMSSDSVFKDVVVEVPSPPLRASRLFTALKLALEAEARADRAIADVPSYTGQHSPVDYYGDELREFYEALGVLEQALDGEEGREPA